MSSKKSSELQHEFDYARKYLFSILLKFKGHLRGFKTAKRLLMLAILTCVFWYAPAGQAGALTIDEISPKQLSDIILPIKDAPKVSAKSVAVINQVTGEMLYENDGYSSRIPASLTKLVTALVALDTVPDWNAVCTLDKSDQVGGVQLHYSRNHSYTLNDLLSAALIPSNNDAARAIARCSGVSMEQFIIRMNEKARQFGAWQTKFVEPSGIDANNQTTALDFAKIANGALSTIRLRNILGKPSVKICSIKPVKKCQVLRNTNQLLGDQELQMIAGKTGYLDESGYNFASSVKDSGGHYYIVVVMGSNSKEARFAESKQLWRFVVEKQSWLDRVANGLLNKAIVAGDNTLK